VSIEQFEVGDQVNVLGYDGVILAIYRDTNTAYIAFDDEKFPDSCILPHVIVPRHRRVLH
jgi:hypothetical protein